MHGEHALRHNALVFESQDEHIGRAAAFLRDGLEAGEAAVFGDTRDGLALMREELGADAEQVTLLDVGSIYNRPARTIATYYRTFYEEVQHAPSVRAVAHVQLGPNLAEWRGEWVGYEAATNLAYAHLPVWILCSYDVNTTSDEVLETVWRTHPEVVTDTWRDSDEFETPDSVLRAVTSAAVVLPGLRSLPAGASLEAFREQLARELTAEQVPEGRALELLVAATEIAANALTHGGGIAAVRVGRADGRFVCEVVDRGSGFDDPLAGYLVPRGRIGKGLWIARQLAWRVEFLHSPEGFTARIWL